MEPTLASIALEAGNKVLGMDRWKKFVGEEVDVREYQVVGIEERLCYIRRGTVEGVSEAPPGLILADVKTILRKEDLSTFLGSTNIESIPVAEDVLRETEEKLISFDEIDEIELTEVAEEADAEMVD
jgi:hypothetical protein